MKLYEISHEYQSKFQELDSLDLPPEAVKDTLDSLGIGDKFEQKAINIGLYIKTLGAEVGAINIAIDSLKKRLKSVNNKMGYYKQYLSDHMIACNIPKIHSPLVTIYTWTGPHKLLIKDRGLIPSGYCREQLYVIDEAAIKGDLINGLEVPGCELVQETTLKIK